MAKIKGRRNKMFGAVLLVVGAILVGWGLNEAGSFSGKLSSALSGSPGDRVLGFYIGGAICLLIGLFSLFRR